MKGFVTGQFVYFNMTRGEVYELKRADITVIHSVYLLPGLKDTSTNGDA